MAVCTQCGRESPDGFAFCGSCGSSLAEAAPPREVRKTVTVVFCDVTGSTALGERLDPEALRRTMSRYFDEMRTILERHGGSVEKFIGDAVMAVFGIPQVHEDDALRAVRAAAEMREALGGMEIEGRIGVNTGEVVAGGGETLVTGDAVNVAARLEQAAAPGEILIGSSTLGLVRGAVTTEPVDPLELKGKAEPVAAHRLVSVDPDAAAFARHLDTPLVGRERELGLLRGTFERAVSESACQLFTLLGPAGVGKSRLVAELLGSADATVLRGRCLDYGEGITFWPVIGMLKELGPRGEQVLEHVAEGGGSSAAEIFLAVRRLLEELASERPLIVFFDDIHWGEPTFLDLVDHIADLSRGAPILLLCVARPELLDERPGWAGGKLNATTVLLEPLSADECGRLIEALDSEVDEAVRSRIAEASEGNPLFVEEMLALARDGGPVTVPPTIQALLAARLDRLGSDERSVVERGSVEGTIFHTGAVRELAADRGRGDVSAQLAGLVRKELIRPERATFADEEAYRFRHLLIRDAAYDSLPKKTRAELHERFAGWLESQPVELVEQDEILGHHLEQAALCRRELGEPNAGIETRAAERLAGAGAKALARDDTPAADNLLTRALDLLGPDGPARAPLLVQLLTALIGRGDFTREDRLIAELESDDDPSFRMHGRLARLDLRIRTAPEPTVVEQARRTAEEAIELFERTGDEPGLARAWTLSFFVSWLHSRGDPALAALERAIEHATRAGEPVLAAQLQVFATGPLMFGPIDPATVRSKLDGMRPAAERSPRVECAVLCVEAGLATQAGDFAEARSSYERADTILADLGMTMMRQVMRPVAGDIALAEGHPREAAEIFRAAYEAMGELGEVSFRSTMASYLANALYLEGDLDGAERFAIEGEEMGAEEDVVNFAFGRGTRARIAADRGRLAEAEELGRGAVGYALKTDFPRIHAEAYLALAHVLSRSGRNSEARPLVEQAIALYESRGDVVNSGRGRQLLAEL